MNYILLVFKSVTIANRAKKLAEKNFDYAAVVQLPPHLGTHGCNYCLRIKEKNHKEMLEIADKYSLKIKSSFIEIPSQNGKEYSAI